MPDEPTVGELVRRFAEIASRLDRITDRLESEFVRKEVYEAHLTAMKAEVTEARKDIEEIKGQRSDDQKWRRTAGLAVAVGAVGWLLTIIGLVVAVALKVT